MSVRYNISAVLVALAAALRMRSDPAVTKVAIVCFVAALVVMLTKEARTPHAIYKAKDMASVSCWAWTRI